MTTTPRAPAELSKRAAVLWRNVLTEFELSPAEVEVLRSGLIALDRADAAAAVIVADGLTVLDRYNTPKSHPAVDIEARNRAIFARTVAQLGVRASAPFGRIGGKSGPKPRTAQPRREVRSEAEDGPASPRRSGSE